MKKNFFKLSYIFIFLIVFITFANCTFTDLPVQMLQDFTEYYTGTPINSYSARHKKTEGLNKKGKYEITQINYASEYSPYYPNSYMDIFYSGENPADCASNPVIFFIHGGCFWWGDTKTGNPLGHTEFANYINALTDNGFNVVMIDYALSPEYLFPTALIQTNQALTFLSGKDSDGLARAEKYHLNMDSIILGGNSAGAVICGQYTAALTNESYQNLMGLPQMAISKEHVKAVILDDGFWDWKNMNIGVKVVTGNYMQKTVYLGAKTVNKYDIYNHITKDFPPTVFSVSLFTHDGKRLSKKLTELGVRNLCIKPNEDRSGKEPHCYMIKKMGKSKVVEEEFAQLVEFLKEE